jgi:hypothetical protein
MEDKIINVSEEISDMTVTLKSGKKVPVKGKTIYTSWISGRKDCKIVILQPLSIDNQKM